MSTPQRSLLRASLALATLLTIALAALMALPPTLEDLVARAGIGSSRSPGPLGVLRLRRALELEAVPVARMPRLERISGPHTILIVAPQRDPDAGELGELDAALATGRARLILAGPLPGSLWWRHFAGLETPVRTRRAAGPILDPSARNGSRRVGRANDPGVEVLTSRDPVQADILWRSAGGDPAALAPRRSGGAVVLVVDAAPFQNATVGDLDNVDAILSLFDGDRSVVFDDRFCEPKRGLARPMMALLYGTGPGKVVILLVLLTFWLWAFRSLDPQRPHVADPSARDDVLVELASRAAARAAVAEPSELLQPLEERARSSRGVRFARRDTAASTPRPESSPVGGSESDVATPSEGIALLRRPRRWWPQWRTERRALARARKLIGLLEDVAG